MKRILVVLVMLCIGFTVFAGGEQEADSSGEVEYKLGWYVPAPHPTFEANLIGVDKFTEETGIEIKRVIGPDWNQANETANVQAMIAGGIKQIAICPAHGESAIALFEELAEHDIPVVSFCIPTTVPTAPLFLGTDVAAAAAQAAEALIAEMGFKGKIINVLEQINMTSTTLRKQAIEEVVAKYPDVEIVQEIADMVTVEEATKKISDGLASTINEVDGIITTGFTPTIAICNALSDYYDRGGDREIKAIGIDYDATILGAIENDILFATIAQNPNGQSYLASWIMKYLAEDWSIRDDVYYINAGTVVVTKDNLDSFSNDIDEITSGIKAKLETHYLVKN